MSKRKLLLADDSITIQKVVNLTFADEGIDVFTYGDGNAAFENLEAVSPDIILADVNMPGLSGYELCEQIRSNEAMRNVPVVLLVGSFEPFDQGEADRVGATKHMTKPFSSIAELVEMVKGLLEETPSSNGTSARSQFAEAAEPVAETAGQKAPEIDDIESLYQQSFAETAEMPEPESLDVEFGEDNIDDEMIQTSYSEQDIDTLTDASFFETDDSGVFYPDPEPEQRMEAAETGFALGDTSPAAENGGEPEPSEIRVESLEFEPAPPETRETREDVEEPNTYMLQFDDLDLLELPEIPKGKAFEFATVDEARDSGSRTQVVSLSPELIDIIVQKVVEKMSGRQ